MKQLKRTLMRQQVLELVADGKVYQTRYSFDSLGTYRQSCGGCGSHALDKGALQSLRELERAGWIQHTGEGFRRSVELTLDGKLAWTGWQQ